MVSKTDILVSNDFRFNKYTDSMDTYEIHNNTKFDFGVIAGKINLNSLTKIDVSNLHEKVFHSKNNTDTNFNFNDLSFHINTKEARINNLSSVIQSALYQSSIYHLYSVNKVYDFYKNPDLIVENGFAVNTDVLKQQNLTEKIDDLLKNIDMSEVKNAIPGDRIWMKCYLNLDSPSFNVLDKKEKQTICFLIGFIVDYQEAKVLTVHDDILNDDMTINGTINTSLNVDNVLVSVFNKELQLIGNTISIDGKHFTLKNIDKNQVFYISCHKKNSVVRDTSKKFDFFLSTIVLSSSDNISIDPINTIISEYIKDNDEDDIPVLISRCLQKIGISNHNFDINDKFINVVSKTIELFVYSTSNFVSNSKEIFRVLSRIINEKHSEITILDSEFAVIYLSAIEEIYGILAERSQLFQILSSVSKDVEYDYDLQNVTMANFEKTPTIRESLYTFKYIIDSEQRTALDKRTNTDFIIESSNSNELLFYPNEFVVNWENGKANPSGASTINFFVDSNSFIKITPVSKRAKRYTWLQNKDHTFDTLLTGLFGELVVGTRVAPIETTDSGYIEKDSLTKIVRNYKSNYFGSEHDNMIRNLKMFYKNLWENNTESYKNILNTDGTRSVFNKNDTFACPIDISFRYKLGSNDKNNKQRVVEGVWNLKYNFKVV